MANDSEGRTCIAVGHVNDPLALAAQQYAYYSLACVSCNSVEVVHDTQQNQWVHHDLIRDLHLRHLFR